MKHICLLLMFIYPMFALPSGHQVVKNKAANHTPYNIKRDVHRNADSYRDSKDLDEVPKKIQRRHGHYVKVQSIPDSSVNLPLDSKSNQAMVRSRRKSGAFESLKLHNAESVPRAMGKTSHFQRSIPQPIDAGKIESIDKKRSSFIKRQVKAQGKRDVAQSGFVPPLAQPEDLNKNAKIELSERTMVSGNTSIDILQRKTIIETQIHVANLKPNVSESREPIDGAEEIKDVIDAVLGGKGVQPKATQPLVTTVFEVATGQLKDNEIMVNANRGVTVGNFELPIAASTPAGVFGAQNLWPPMAINSTGPSRYQEKDVIMQSIVEEKSKETLRDKKNIGVNEGVNEDVKRSNSPVTTIN